MHKVYSSISSNGHIMHVLEALLEGVRERDSAGLPARDSGRDGKDQVVLPDVVAAAVTVLLQNPKATDACVEPAHLYSLV